MLADAVNESPRAGMIDCSLSRLMHDAEPLLAYGRAHARLLALQDGPVDLARGDVYAGTGEIAELVRFPSEQRFARILAAIVEASLGKSGLTLIGSRLPHAAAAERALVERYFPRIAYLFALRNPLHTIESMLGPRNTARAGGRPWPRNDVDAAIGEYRRNARVLLSHAARYPDDCFVVEYDDMREDRGGTMQRVADFLGVPLDAGSVPPVANAAVRPERGAIRSVLTESELDRVRGAFPDAIASWHERRLTGRAADVAGALADCAGTVRAGTTLD
jgi:sulfotransferase family protein